MFLWYHKLNKKQSRLLLNNFFLEDFLPFWCPVKKDNHEFFFDKIVRVLMIVLLNKCFHFICYFYYNLAMVWPFDPSSKISQGFSGDTYFDWPWWCFLLSNSVIFYHWPNLIKCLPLNKNYENKIKIIIMMPNLQLSQNFRFVLSCLKIIFMLYMAIIWNIRVTCGWFTEIWRHENKWCEFNVMMLHEFSL